ncbi:hypothetical protein [Bacillus cereus group sp. BfR-BA-01380]|nr:hypothetical protein [Bacillus cereus group sp. BfR-BA-01380]
MPKITNAKRSTDSSRGDLPGPIVRDTNPAGAEFIDKTGVK